MTNTHNEEEKKETQCSEDNTMQKAGYIRVQATEDTKAEAFMTAKTDDPLARRDQMAENCARARGRSSSPKGDSPF